MPCDLGPAVFGLVPSGEGGEADLHPAAQGHCSEGPPSWLEKRLTPACKGEAEIFAQLQRQAHESFLPHKTLAQGEGPAWSSLGSPGFALPQLKPSSPPESVSFLPETSPLRSEVSEHDLFLLFFSHQTHPVLSSSPCVTGTDLYFYF